MSEFKPETPLNNIFIHAADVERETGPGRLR